MGPSALRGRLIEARLRRAQLVIIDGPVGIGKSALLSEFLGHETADVQVAWLRCDRFEQNIPFAAAELLLGEPREAACSEWEVGRRLTLRLAAGVLVQPARPVAAT